MKKYVKFAIAFCCVLLCLTLCSCGKSEAVKNLEKEIDSIGTVTIESYSIFEIIDNLYNNLPEDERDDVGNYSVYLSCKDKYNELLNKKCEEILAQINGASKMTLKDAYELMNVIERGTDEFNSKKTDISDLMKCEGEFIRMDGKYPTDVQFYIKGGRYWMNIDFPGYMGTISDGMVYRDERGGFLFSSDTIGNHIFLFNDMSVDFNIQFGSEKLHIVWGTASEYTLTRN